MQEEISNIIRRDITPIDGVLITVTHVQASDDLYYATVFVSILAPSPEVEAEALAALQRETGAVQHRVNRKLRMRPVPKITFAIDVKEQRRERIEKLLAEDQKDN